METASIQSVERFPQRNGLRKLIRKTLKDLRSEFATPVILESLVKEMQSLEKKLADCDCYYKAREIQFMLGGVLYDWKIASQMVEDSRQQKIITMMFSATEILLEKAYEKIKGFKADAVSDLAGFCFVKK